MVGWDGMDGMGGYLRLTVCLEHLTVLINIRNTNMNDKDHLVGQLTTYGANKWMEGRMEGRLSPFDGLLRAPYGANKEAQKDKRKYQRMKVAGDKRGSML